MSKVKRAYKDYSMYFSEGRLGNSEIRKRWDFQELMCINETKMGKYQR